MHNLVHAAAAMRKRKRNLYSKCSDNTWTLANIKGNEIADQAANDAVPTNP